MIDLDKAGLARRPRIMSPRLSLGQVSEAFAPSVEGMPLCDVVALMQKMPAMLFFIPPMECKEVKSMRNLPQGQEWQYEIKFDGYRCIAIKQKNEVELFSRRGLAFRKFVNLHHALAEQPPLSFVLDGEIVALDTNGRSDFNALQHAGTRKFDMHFYAFDLLNLNGKRLLELPLHERQARLQSEFRPSDFIHFPLPLRAGLNTVIAKIKQFGFEGVVAKEKGSAYLPGKISNTWIKLKLKPTEEFIVGGYIPGAHGIDQLVVGRFAGKKLMYVASLDDGFVPATRNKVLAAIQKLTTRECPFANLPEKKAPHRMDAEKMQTVAWVRPKIVAEIAMNEWTPDGHLRHAEFKRLRDDKTVSQVPAYPPNLRRKA
jgi:bifunctional non-homologous end joining protein LigD